MCKCVTHPVGLCGLDESGWIGCVYICECACACVRESANVLHNMSDGANGKRVVHRVCVYARVSLCVFTCVVINVRVCERVCVQICCTPCRVVQTAPQIVTWPTNTPHTGQTRLNDFLRCQKISNSCDARKKSRFSRIAYPKQFAAEWVDRVYMCVCARMCVCV